MPGAEGRIRLVVLDHNGGELLRRCFDALAGLDWPADQLELVLIDNASVDGSADLVRAAHPGVRVIRSPRNAGFPANNLALADLAGVRYVGLVNNDAFVGPGWLRAMVAALDADPGLGAVTGRLLYAPRFVGFTVSTPTTRGRWGDPRRLGVRVSGLRVGGEDRWRATQVVDGGWGAEPDGDGGVVHWTSERATVRVPLDAVAGPLPASRRGRADVRPGERPGDGPSENPGDADPEVEAEVDVEVDVEVEVVVQVRLDAPGRRLVTLDGGAQPVTAEVGPDPTWVEIEVRGAPFDVINNVGGIVFDDGYGTDRGGLEVDRGQYDEPADVFAWSGGGVMLRPSYLHEVGLFEESFFLYYEDTDLSWRGRAQGWRYRFEPAAVARHVHSASSGVGSEVFQVHTERNRLLMLVRNAPWPMVVSAVVRFGLATVSYAWRDVVGPALRRAPTAPLTTRHRMAALVSFGRRLPAALGQRRRLRRRQTVPDAEIARGLTGRRPAG
jgi:GT2 family glycosyltransferase